MAEIVGLIASLGTIAAAGYQVAKTISTVADELGEAGTQINGIATDMRAVSLILHELKKRLSIAQRITRQVQDVTHEIIALCRADIKGIESFLIPLMSPAGKDVKLLQKLRWLFAKAKVSTRRASLDSLKLTLNLFMHTLDFSESGEMDDYIKDEVHALILETRNTKTTLLNSEQHDRNLVIPHHHNSGLLSPTRRQIDSSDATAGEIEVADPTSPHTPIDGGTLDLDNHESKETQIISHKPIPEPTDPLGSMSDDDFILIAEHVRLQNVVRSLALAVIYPRTSRDNPFKDEAPDHGHEWQDGYGARYEQENPKKHSAMPINDDMKRELEKTKLELRDCESKLKQSIEQLSAFRQEQTARKEAERQASWEEEIRRDAESKQKSALKDAERRRGREEKIRRDAEESFHRRMEDMRRAQEEAKKEIENAKVAAERAARERIEAERRAEDERQKQYADALNRAEEKARMKLESELQAVEARRRRQEREEEAALDTARAEVKAEQEQKRRDKRERLRKYIPLLRESSTNE